MISGPTPKRRPAYNFRSNDYGITKSHHYTTHQDSLKTAGCKILLFFRLLQISYRQKKTLLHLPITYSSSVQTKMVAA